MFKSAFYVSATMVGTALFGWCLVAWCCNGIPYFVCPLHYLTGLPCPFCGLTRSCLLLLHGEVGMALQTNPLIALAPIALLCSFLIIYNICMGKDDAYTAYLHICAKGLGVYLKFAAIALILGVWIYQIQNLK